MKSAVFFEKFKAMSFFGAFLAVIVLSCVITIRMSNTSSYDDAFITYRCARNLAMGHGLVYNPGEAGSATTTPLFALILAGLGRMTAISQIPLWGSILSGVSLFLLALFTLLHARQENQPGVAWVVIVFLFCNPFLESVWGGEALLCLALSLGAFYFYFRPLGILPAIFCFLAFLTRGEGLIPMGVMVGHSLFKHKKLPWIEILVFIALMACWYPASHLLGAGFLPHTLSAKMAQMQSGAFGPFVKTTLDWYRAFLVGSPTFSYIQPSLILTVLPLLAGIGALFCLLRPTDRWGCILIALFLYVAGYSILAVPFYTWYAFPIFYGLILLAGIGFNDTWQTIPSFDFSNAALRNVLKAILGGILIVTVGAAGKYAVRPLPATPSDVRRMYTQSALWLKHNTPANASVGFFEIGFVGYYSERRMVDPVGLVNADVPAHVAQGDFTWAFKHYEPDYILLTPVRWASRIGKIREEEWFKARYEFATAIAVPGYYDSPLSIYRKR